MVTGYARRRLPDGRRVKVTIRRRAKRRQGNTGVRIPRNVSSLALNTLPMPNKFRTKMKYVMYGSMDPGAGLYSEQVFNALSLYDPDVTGAGHQPRGFDQTMTMYQLFQVTNCLVRIQVVGGPTATGQPGVIALSASQDNSSYISSGFDFFEQPSVVYSFMNNDASVSKELKLNIIPHTFLGIDKEDASLKGGPGASPSQALYVRFTYASTDLSAENPGPISYIATLVYDAEFSARKVPTVS